MVVRVYRDRPVRLTRSGRPRAPQKALDHVKANAKGYKRPTRKMLRAWRKDCGWTQAQAAVELGVSGVTYRRLESGDYLMTTRMWMVCRFRWLTTDAALVYWTAAFDGKAKYARMLKQFVEQMD